MGKGLLGSHVMCFLPPGETEVVDCGHIHAGEKPAMGAEPWEPTLSPSPLHLGPSGFHFLFEPGGQQVRVKARTR